MKENLHQCVFLLKADSGETVVLDTLKNSIFFYEMDMKEVASCHLVGAWKQQE